MSPSLPNRPLRKLRSGSSRETCGKGIDAKIINIHTIKPLDEEPELIVAAAKETGKVVTVEEHSVIGGLGSAVCDALAEKCPVPVKKIGVQDVFGESPARQCSASPETQLAGAEDVGKVAKELRSIFEINDKRKQAEAIPENGAVSACLLSAVFLKAEVRLSRPPQVPGRPQDSLRDGFRHMKNRCKPGCLQKKLYKTARYIHNACDKNIPDLGQRLTYRARPDRPVSDRDVSLMTPRTKRSIDHNEQSFRVAGMDVRNPVRQIQGVHRVIQSSIDMKNAAAVRRKLVPDQRS